MSESISSGSGPQKNPQEILQKANVTKGKFGTKKVSLGGEGEKSITVSARSFSGRGKFFKKALEFALNKKIWVKYKVENEQGKTEHVYVKVNSLRSKVFDKKGRVKEELVDSKQALVQDAKTAEKLARKQGRLPEYDQVFRAVAKVRRHQGDIKENAVQKIGKAIVFKSGEGEDQKVLVKGSKLGSGASKVVYFAVDLFSGEEVALQQIKGGQNSTSLKKELNILDGIDNFQGIAPQAKKHTVSFGSQRVTFLTQKVYNQGDLRKYFSSEKSLNSKQTLSIATDILSGAKTLHKQGIIHNDVKPDNILLERDPNTKEYHAGITDFGLATKGGSKVPLTGGTPLTMSPGHIKAFNKEKSRTITDAKNHEVQEYAYIIYELVFPDDKFVDEKEEFVETRNVLKNNNVQILKNFINKGIDSRLKKLSKENGAKEAFQKELLNAMRPDNPQDSDTTLNNLLKLAEEYKNSIPY